MDENAGEIFVDAPALEDITGASGAGANLNIEKSKLGTKKYRAPRYKGPFYDLPNIDDYMIDEEIPAPKKPEIKQAQREEPVIPAPTTTPKISAVSEADPVRILAKTCKKHPTEINLTLNINLPSKSIYNIAESEFEDGGKNFVDCLVEDIDITEIVKSLSVALRQAYAEGEV